MTIIIIIVLIFHIITELSSRETHHIVWKCIRCSYAREKFMELSLH